MSVLFLWAPRDPDEPTHSVIAAMERALRVRPEQVAALWTMPGLGVGILECDPCGTLPAFDPFRVDDRHFFWMVGEAFFGGDLVEVASSEDSRRLEFRRQVFEALYTKGFERIASLDGEFIVLHWDARLRTMTIANDRFGGLPLYWAQSRHGVALAGGVRGVVMAPGVEPKPDPEALREAVTFGGFRLGDRTNIEGVKMLSGGTIVKIREGAIGKRRYWRYGDIPPRVAGSESELFEEASSRWECAISRRLDNCDRPGQTLSGGLDSRAILAEAAARTRNWAAVTYGIPGCDDARFAERAAAAAGARFRFVSLYDRPEDWLTARTRHIQTTDGLIALGDLMHVETVEMQAEEMHLHLSGYVGDAICGPTFGDIERTEDLYRTLPYYGTELGMSGARAHERILQLVSELNGAHPRWAVYENKLPQATNRWTASWRPWIRVRKPFLDYELFDFWQGLPTRVRTKDRLYERLLIHRYPKLFAKIPHQKTGVPVLTPDWKRQLTRVARFALRKMHVVRSQRQYHDDRRHARGAIRTAIEEMITHPHSLCGEILGPTRVREVLNAWFDAGAAPDQVIGAMYVFECYQRGLSGFLRNRQVGAID